MKLIYFLDRIIEYGFYALFFATPLIFNPSRIVPSFELFEWNKMMFVYIMTTLITGAWIGKMLLRGKLYIAKTPFNLPILLFLFSQALSALFSIDRHVSIFGYYSRFHGGLLSTFCYTLLYFAFVSNREVINVVQLFLYALVSGTLVAGYGIMERFGIDAHMWVQDVRSRVFSTLGQPNWLAAYLAILLPISVAKLISNFKFQISKKQIKNQKNNSSSPPLKLREGRVGLWDNWIIGIYLIIGLLFYICLLFTKSRSGFLGFWSANALFWIGYFFFSSRHSGKSRPQSRTHPESASISDPEQARMTIFFILNSLFFILNFFIHTPFPQYNRYLTTEVFQKTPVEQDSKPPSGDTIISVGVTGSEKIREIVWKGAFAIIKDYPLFGTGPETFAYAYYKYRPKEHNLTSEWDFLYNRAHNEFLNVAATSGLVGLTTYLILIGTVIVWTSRSVMLNLFQHSFPKQSPKILKQVQDDNTKIFNQSQITPLSIALLASYVSILITNFFGFSVVIIGLYFFLIPAFLYSLTLTKSTPTFSTSATFSTFQKSVFVLLILLTSYIEFQLFRFWIADTLYAQALSLSKQEEYKAAYPKIVLAVNERPGEPVYHDERASITGHLAEIALENREASSASNYIKEAIVESGTALKISPQNVSFWKTRTRIFFTLSEIDKSFIQDALDSLTIAQELAPTDPKITYNLAILYGRADKNAKAIEYLKQTIDLKPDYRDAYIALAVFYEEEKEIDKARETLESVLKLIDPNDQEVKDRLEKL